METTIHFSPSQVLIVNDCRISQLVQKRFLSQIMPEAAVVTCNNGLEALTALYNTYVSIPDNNVDTLILLNLAMPVMDGWEFLEHFNHLETGIRRRIRTVAVTSFLYSEIIRKLESNHFVAGYYELPLYARDYAEIVAKFTIPYTA